MRQAERRSVSVRVPTLGPHHKQCRAWPVLPAQYDVGSKILHIERRIMELEIRSSVPIRVGRVDVVGELRGKAPKPVRILRRSRRDDFLEVRVRCCGKERLRVELESQYGRKCEIEPGRQSNSGSIECAKDVSGISVGSRLCHVEEVAHFPRDAWP